MRDAGAKKAKNTKMRSTQGQMPLGAIFMLRWWFMIERPEYLSLQLRQKHLRRADVVRGSHLDRTYVYQIFSGKKTPSRDKLLAIAFGLQLSAEETQKMLKLSGNLELYVRRMQQNLL